MLVVLLARWGCRDVFNASLDHLILKLVSPRVRDVLLVASVIRLRAPLVAIAVLALLLILRALHFVSLALRANLFLVLDQRSVSNVLLGLMPTWRDLLPARCAPQAVLNPELAQLLARTALPVCFPEIRALKYV